MERSYELITNDDLSRLLILANNDLHSFFLCNTKYVKQYKDRQSLIVLAQGAALHFVNHLKGVKDFDVWFFFPQEHLKLAYRRRGAVDFGESRFGKYPHDTVYKGRRVDVLMRSDASFNCGEPEDCIEKYLREARTTTAKFLAQKAMVGLWPDRLFGKILWPSQK